MTFILASATFCYHYFQLFFRFLYRVGRYFLEEQLKYHPKSSVVFVSLSALRNCWIFGCCRNPHITFHSLPHQVQGAPWMRFSKFFFLWLTSDSPSGGLFWEYSDNQAKRTFRATLGAKLFGSEMNWATQGKCWGCYCLRCLKLRNCRVQFCAWQVDILVETTRLSCLWQLLFIIIIYCFISFRSLTSPLVQFCCIYYTVHYEHGTKLNAFVLMWCLFVSQWSKVI